jgi:cell division protein FtsI/penicillin-binding protein 2
MSRIKAKLVYKKICENQGKPMAVSKAMEAVGYSPSYCHNPQEFLGTKTAQELEKKYLPDELLARKHSELLEAGSIQHYNFPSIGNAKRGKRGKKQELNNDEIKTIVESVVGCRLIYVKRDWQGAWAYYQAPDHKSRKDAIDMAYKRKGNYAPEQIELTKRKYQDLSNAELVALEKKLKDFLLKK